MKSAWLLILPFLCLTSCATITRGVHEKLRVDSDPPGAKAELSSGERGITPVTFVKKRKENFDVTVSKPGFISQTVQVRSNFSPTGGGAIAGNVLGPSVIGMGVDAVSGATLSLYPNPVSVRLAPSGQSGNRERAAPKRQRQEATPSPVQKSSSKPKT